MGVGICKYLSKHGCSDALSLMFGHDVQMVQKPVVLLRTNRDKAYSGTIGFDEATQRRIKRGQEAIPRTLRIKASCSLQTLAHRRDANGDQDVRVRLRGGQESQIHAKARYVPFQSGATCYVAAFFFAFAFGFTGLATTGGSGVPSIAERRPEVKV